MEIKPIRNEAEYRAALAQIDQLWDSEPGSSESDRLDILTTLVEAYEARHHPIFPPDPIEAIRFRMEQLGLSRKDLEGILGSRARVSEVLSGKRRLSLEMIRRLHTQLGVPVEVLLDLRAVDSARQAEEREALEAHAHREPTHHEHENVPIEALLVSMTSRQERRTLFKFGQIESGHAR